MARIWAYLGAAAVLVGLALTAGLVLFGRPDDPFADCRDGVVSGTAQIGGPFSLTDQNGSRVDETVLGELALVYFGYAYCPDVCPVDMARNASVARTLAEKGIEVTPVFISIDPDRDTPEVLKLFADGLGDVVALTGTPAEIAAAAKAYAVYYAKAGEDEFYLMDHSTQTYLMGRSAGFLDFYPRSQGEDEIVASVSCFARAL